MPGVRDKLILNSGNLAAGDCAVDGNADAIQEQFATAGIAAKEIEEAGFLWHPDALAFRSEAEGICSRIDTAQDAYITAQNECRLDLRSLTDRMRQWFDKAKQNQLTQQP